MSTVLTTESDALVPALTPAEANFLGKVEEFVAREVAPFTRDWEDATAFPDDIWLKLGAAGLLDLAVPKELGGPGWSCRVYVDCIRLLATGDPALAMNVAAVNGLCLGHLVHFSTDEQRAKYLAGARKGEIRMAWGLTEPDAGSDARRVKTVATPLEGKPGWVRLDGEKMFITNGGRADLIVIMARMGEGGLSAFLLETDQPGFQVVERIHTVGVKASNTVRFTLDNARAWHTPCTFDQAIGLLYRGRLGIAGMAVGIAEQATRLAVEYSKQREQFNRRLCDMQSVQNMLADNATDVEAAKLLLYRGAAMYDRGENVVSISSMAKLFASEAANRCTNNAVQIHGGRGMTRFFLAEKLWRDAKLTEIGEGCSEIQRMVIAKQLTK